MTLAAMLLISLVLLLAAGLWTSAKMILQPPRMTQGKAFYLLKRVTPDDLGLKFQPVRFSVMDEATRQKLNLAGWWIPHPAGGSKTVVLVHGYADAKVGALAWASIWQQLGFNILAYDQRAHGESEGRYCTGGAYERNDLSQIIDEMRSRWAAQTQSLALFGISLGASPVLAVAVERDDIHAVVLECPFRSYANAVEGLANELQLPLRRMLPITLRLAAWMSGADLHRVENLPLIRESRCPIFAIAAAIDPYVSRNDASAIAEAIAARNDASRFWLAEGSTHLRAIEADPAAYSSAIFDFLESISTSD